MREPNFIIAGGVASGTGSLTDAIKNHPEIYLPAIMRPECGFFYKKGELDKGRSYYLKNWFSDVKDEKAIGERSSLYLHGDFNKVASRIHKEYPKMKLIFCLRNPTERAWGGYRFTALSGLETLSFKEALDQEEERINNSKGWIAEIRPHAYRARGCYFDQLKPFLEHFPKEQILCIKSESLAKKTDEVLREVYEFLGVDQEFKTKPERTFSSPNVKNLKIQYGLRKVLNKKLDVATEEYRQYGPQSLLAKAIGLNLTKQKYPMPEDQRKRLNEFYAPHNEKLAKLLNWDLSDWH